MIFRDLEAITTSARDGGDRARSTRRHQVKVALFRGFHRRELALDDLASIALVTSRQSQRVLLTTAHGPDGDIFARGASDGHQAAVRHIA